MATQETQTANAANQIMGLLAAFQSLQTQVDALNTLISATSIATLIAQFPTAALTSTGGLGAADGTPTAAHPINTSVAPGTLLNRAVSPADLSSMLTALVRLSNAVKGVAVGTDSTVVGLTYKVIG